MTAPARVPCHHPRALIKRNQIDNYGVQFDICNGCGESWIWGRLPVCKCCGTVCAVCRKADR